MVVITTRLGGRTVSKEKFKLLLDLMSLPIFSGCLGGIPEKARFLTGRYEEMISYLDPHYVGDPVHPMTLTHNTSAFQCQEVRYMAREELDPQMALCFFLTGLEDLQMLVEAIDKMESSEAFLSY